jgi:hypothetical protein
MKQLVIEDVLPSLFYVAKRHEDHQTQPTSNLRKVIEWRYIMPPWKQTVWQYDMTDSENETNWPQEPATTPSKILDAPDKSTPSSADEEDASTNYPHHTELPCARGIRTHNNFRAT